MKEPESLKHENLFTVCYYEGGEQQINRYRCPVDAQRKAESKQTIVIPPHKK